MKKLLLCLLMLCGLSIAACAQVEDGKVVGGNGLLKLYYLEDSPAGVRCYKMTNVDAISCVKVGTVEGET